MYPFTVNSGRREDGKREDVHCEPRNSCSRPSEAYLLLLFSCPIMNNSLQPHGLYSMPGLPVPYHLLEFAHVHVYCIGEAIQRHIYECSPLLSWISLLNSCILHPFKSYSPGHQGCMTPCSVTEISEGRCCYSHSSDRDRKALRACFSTKITQVMSIAV